MRRPWACLRSATTAYLSVLRDVIPLLEQWADVSRLREPVCSQLLDEIRAALHVREMGTPAGISRVVAEMLGER